MVSRRFILSVGVMLTLLLQLLSARAAELADNGLHIQEWIYSGEVDFRKIQAAAAADDKGIIVLVEQRGCPYCAELHSINFAKTELTDYMREHFVIVQVDMWGDRNVTDFDGEVLREEQLSDKWQVQYTPTTLVFKRASTPINSRKEAETFRLPGYLKPFYYMAALEFLISDAYIDQRFQSFVEAKVDVAAANGIDPENW